MSKSLLTTQQKINVLLLTKNLLGPKGENWIKGAWFAKRATKKNTKRVGILGFTPVNPSAADCWCLLGAMEEAAFRLGYSKQRRRSQTIGKATSLRSLIRREHRWDEVEEFNDSLQVEFAAVVNVLNKRLRELRTELKKES